MKKAVFFDLDGTLLPMDMDEFFADYFRSISKYIGDFIEPEVVEELITASVLEIAADLTPNVSNIDKFVKVFKRKDERVTDGLLEKIDEYYLYKFDELCNIVRHTPLLKEIVDVIRSKGYRMVLATYPCFPRIATYKRIKWAGFDPGDFEYISSFENSCYCKPHREYYQEILEKTGLTAEECYMVGNNVDEDIVAKEYGFDVFFLNNFGINPRKKIIECDHGNYEDLLDWAKALEEM